MNWLEKIEVLRELEKHDVTIDVRFRENSWKPGEIDQLKQTFNLLPESYLNFIRAYDRVGIAFVAFYGSQKYGRFSVESKIKEHHDLLKNNYFPFGNDIAGDVYMFNRNHEVVRWPKDDYFFKLPPQLIANSFEEFIDDCLLGKRYSEFEFIENNSFYDLMQKLGWI